MADFLSWYVDIVLNLGYVGIFFMTLIEGTILPIPSETTMLPAGFLIYSGEMNFWLVLFSSVLGTMSGAFVNYYIAKKYGRQLIISYGKYFFFSEKKLIGVEKFFDKYGEISTFTGRLTPGVRHLISFVAGLSRMRIKSFIIFTALGSSIWLLILILAGYFIGENTNLIKQYMPKISLSVIAAVGIIIFVYWLIKKNKKTDLKDLNDK